MTTHESAGPFDLPAMLSPATGAAAIPTVGLPPLSIALSICTLVLALTSRRRLRANATLRGSRASLLGFLLGAISILLVAFPFVVSFVVHAIAGACAGAGAQG